MTQTAGALTALIVDDERLAREKLAALLADIPTVEVIGAAAGGAAAVELANRLRPDVLFLDVRMPEVDGFQVVEQLDYDPALVFTTAHDHYAVAAFEVRAIDYLLKPFGRDRLMEALSRLVIPAAGEPHVSVRMRLAGGFDAGRALTQLFIRTPRRILPVPVRDVSRFEACDDYVTVHEAGATHLATVRMDDLETLLDPAEFLRIHRSHIVRLAAVAAIEPDGSGRYLVTMQDGTALLASRSRSRELRRRFV